MNYYQAKMGKISTHFWLFWLKKLAIFPDFPGTPFPAGYFPVPYFPFPDFPSGNVHLYSEDVTPRFYV